MGDRGEGTKHHHNVIRRYWEIVNMHPEFADPSLAALIEEFTMTAPPEKLFRMQEMIIREGEAFMVEDPRWCEILDRMDGNTVGLAIGSEYRSTVSLADRHFTVEMVAPDRSVPVLSVRSRKDYVDALLRRRDIVRMIITGRLHATHKLTLARWGLSFYEYLKDDTLFRDFLAHQKSAEEKILAALRDS